MGDVRKSGLGTGFQGSLWLTGNSTRKTSPGLHFGMNGVDMTPVAIALKAVARGPVRKTFVTDERSEGIEP